MVSDEIFKLNEFEIEVVKSMICAEHKLGVEHKLGAEHFVAEHTSSKNYFLQSFINCKYS